MNFTEDRWKNQLTEFGRQAPIQYKARVLYNIISKFYINYIDFEQCDIKFYELILKKIKLLSYNSFETMDKSFLKSIEQYEEFDKPGAYAIIALANGDYNGNNFYLSLSLIGNIRGMPEKERQYFELIKAFESARLNSHLPK